MKKKNQRTAWKICEKFSKKNKKNLGHNFRRKKQVKSQRENKQTNFRRKMKKKIYIHIFKEKTRKFPRKIPK